jgi:hypothetical protein
MDYSNQDSYKLLQIVEKEIKLLREENAQLKKEIEFINNSLCDYIIIGFVNDKRDSGNCLNAVYANINSESSECINDTFYYTSPNDTSGSYLLLHQYAQLKIKKLDLTWISGVHIKDKKGIIIYNSSNNIYNNIDDQLTNLYNECNKYGIQLLIDGIEYNIFNV